jgi:hypothetical protein
MGRRPRRVFRGESYIAPGHHHDFLWTLFGKAALDLSFASFEQLFLHSGGTPGIENDEPISLRQPFGCPGNFYPDTFPDKRFGKSRGDPLDKIFRENQDLLREKAHGNKSFSAISDLTAIYFFVFFFFLWRNGALGKAL